MIAVQKRQRRHQVYRFGKSLFMDLCLLFGDGNAAHIFTATHRSIIENFVLPHIEYSEGNLVLVVDDSIYISGDPAQVEEYNRRYRYALETLGMEGKNHDEELRKTFHPSTKGEVLGYWLDTTQGTWTIAEGKIADILRQTDQTACEGRNHGPSRMKLKQFQRIQGKMADLAKLNPFIKARNMVISRELAAAVKAHNTENDWAETRQTECCRLSARAKTDLLVLRAVVARLRQHPLPLYDPRHWNPITAEVTIFCDASGDTGRKAYLGLLVTEGPLSESDLALAYPIPRCFLEASDEKGPNKNNTMLLELLAILTVLVEWGPLLRGRTVICVTDSLNLNIIMRNGRSPKGSNTCLALQAFYELAAEVETSISVQWKRRRSCTWTRAADDLSHADFHKLPFDQMSNPVCKTLSLPEPIGATLGRATFSQTEGFPDLRRRIQQDWKRKGWCKGLWQHDEFF